MERMNQLLLDKLKTQQSDEFLVYPECSLHGIPGKMIDLLAVTNKGIFVMNTVEAEGNISGTQTDMQWTANDYMNISAEDIKFNNPSIENLQVVQYIKTVLEHEDIDLPIYDFVVFGDNAMLMGVQTTSIKTQLRDLSYNIVKCSRVNVSKEVLAQVYNKLNAYQGAEITDETPVIVEEAVIVEEPVQFKEPVQFEKNISNESKIIDKYKELPLDRPLDEKPYISKSEAPGYKPVDYTKPNSTNNNRRNKETLENLENERTLKILTLVVAFFVLVSIGGFIGMVILIIVLRNVYKIKADNFNEWFKKAIGILIVAAIILSFIRF